VGARRLCAKALHCRAARTRTKLNHATHINEACHVRSHDISFETRCTSKSHLVHRNASHPRPGAMPCSSRLPARHTGKHLRVDPPFCAPEFSFCAWLPMLLEFVLPTEPLPPPPTLLSALLMRTDAESTQSRSSSRASRESPPPLPPAGDKLPLYVGDFSGLKIEWSEDKDAVAYSLNTYC